MTSEFQLDMEGFPLTLSNGDEEIVQSCIHTEDSLCVKIRYKLELADDDNCA